VFFLNIAIRKIKVNLTYLSVLFINFRIIYEFSSLSNINLVFNNYLLSWNCNVGQKYPCLFSESATISKAMATSVIQYHIIPGKTFSYQQLKNLAQNADYMTTTAFNGKKLNVTVGGNKINGYSSINNPDIGSKQSQAIHGIKTLLVPPGLIVNNELLYMMCILYFLKLHIIQLKPNYCVR